MTLKLLEYRPHLDNFKCEEVGRPFIKHIVDLAGQFEDISPSDLVGRTIECEELIPYVKLPSGDVRIV